MNWTFKTLYVNFVKLCQVEKFSFHKIHSSEVTTVKELHKHMWQLSRTFTARSASIPAMQVPEEKR